MRFLSLLLLCTQSFLAVCAPDSPSDNSDSGWVYTYSISPLNPKYLPGIKATLKDRYGVTRFSGEDKFGDTLRDLQFDTPDHSLTDALRAIEGVRYVSQGRHCPASPKNPVGHCPSSPSKIRRDVGTYVAIATDDSNVEKTEEFLRSQIVPGTDLHHIERGGKMIGWSDLVLEPDAKRVVVNYREGIARVMLSSPGAPQNVPPAQNRVPSDPSYARRATGNMDVYQALANKTSDSQITDKYLKSKVQPSQPIGQLKKGDGTIVGWYNLVLDPGSAKEVKEYEGIDSTTFQLEDELVHFRALTSHDSSEIWGPTVGASAPVPVKAAGQIYPRTTKWEKQAGADKALVMDSQYKGADLGTLKDFVHLSEPGKGTFVYVLGEGVQVEAGNSNYEYEFHPPNGNADNIPVLQTSASSARNENPRTDEDVDGHDTSVASKAVGTQYGVAKSASLIVVKMRKLMPEFGPALKLVVQDIEAHPERASKSVVLITWGSKQIWTYASVKADETSKENYEHAIKEVLDLGVPIVCASGNEAETVGRTDIDSLPAVYQDRDTPLINIGAATYEGDRLGMSQYGNQLTMYAPGYQVAVQGVNGFDTIYRSGTSVAAPQVAGLIATYLGYDQKPWDDNLKGVPRVRAIRDYLLTERSSWERKAGIRMIWNGAGPDDHKNAGTSPGAAPSAPVTHGPAPGKGLSIILRSKEVQKPHSAGVYTNTWRFYTTPRGHLPVCDSDSANLARDSTVINGHTNRMTDNPPWPTGTYSLKIGSTACEYKNDGKDNPGKLWCGDKAFDCFAEAMKTASDGRRECSGTSAEITERPVVHCEWAD